MVVLGLNTNNVSYFVNPSNIDGNMCLNMFAGQNEFFAIKCKNFIPGQLIGYNQCLHRLKKPGRTRTR